MMGFSKQIDIYTLNNIVMQFNSLREEIDGVISSIKTDFNMKFADWYAFYGSAEKVGSSVKEITNALRGLRDE